MRDITLEDTFHHDFTTRAFGTGIPTTLSGTPALSVKEGGNATPITAGVSVAVDTASVTGMNEATIVATAANGFENGKSYSIYVSTGTVDSVSAVGEVVGQFTVGLSAAAIDLANGTDGLTALKTGIDDIPTTAEFEARTIVAANYFDPAADTVALVTTTTNVTNQVTANVTAISDDATAADNLELMYDGTGYTADDTAPASRAQVANIGSVGAGGVNFDADTDNVLGAIKSITFVGVQTSGTFASTSALDGIFHVIDDTTDAIDIVYGFTVGGGRISTDVGFDGFLNSSNDTLDVFAFDFIGTDWDQIGTVAGQNGSANINEQFPIFQRHTGTGADLGITYIRFQATGQSNPTFNVDRLIVSAVASAATIGYEGGAVWVDTGLSNTNTESFVDGTVDRPVSTIAAAKTIADNLNIKIIHSLPGSSFTLSVSFDGFEFIGVGYTVTLASSISGTLFDGATLSGTGTGVLRPVFRNCEIGTVSLEPFIAEESGLNGTITFTAAGDYEMTDCHSSIAGPTTPIIDTGAGVGNVNLTMPDFQQGIEIRNLNTLGTDEFSISGTGQIVYAASSSGTVQQRGAWQVTNTGGVTITEDDTTSNVVDILVDTGTTLDTKLNDIQGASFSSGTDSLEAIRDRGDAAWTTGAGGSDRLLMVDTTIATLATQTNFTLTAGSADDKAYENLSIVVEDVSASTQKAVGMVLTYTGATKTVVLKEALAFTIAATDKVYILAENSLKSTVANRQLDVTATGAAGMDWANIENPTTAVDLSGTDIQLVDTTTTNTDMRGTDSALLASSAPANFGDMAITVTTGRITVGTNNDKTGYSISGSKTTLDALNDVAATDIVSAGAITTLSGAVVNVDLVDTTTTNTDMRGTDSAATAASVAALNDISVADILTTQMTETYAADGVAPTLAQAIFLVQQQLGDFAIAGTTITVKKLDGSTTAATFTLDDGTNPTSSTRTT